MSSTGNPGVISKTFSITYFLVAVVGLLVIGFLIFGYFYQDQAFQLIYSSLEDRLNKKCEEEKISLEEGATKILQETINQKNKEISKIQNQLQEQVKTGEISQQQAINQVKANLQIEKEAAEKLAQELQTLVDAASLKAQEDARKITQLETDITKKINIPTPWTCGIDGLFGPIRVNADKNIECMSNNNWDCLWSKDYASCKPKIEAHKDTYTKPHICKEYEYNTAGHWCQRAKSAYGLL